MRFRISRTSDYAGQQSPCRNATGTETELCRATGSIRRTKWYVELNSLEELLTLAKEVNERLIIDPNDPEIEIYDDCREY